MAELVNSVREGLQETACCSSWSQTIGPENAIPMGLYEVLDRLAAHVLQSIKLTFTQVMSKNIVGDPFLQGPRSVSETHTVRPAETKMCWVLSPVLCSRTPTHS